MGKLVNVPDNIKKEFEKVLTSGGLFKIVSQHPSYFGDTHYQILSIKRYEKNDWKKPVDKLIAEIDRFEEKYHATGARHSDIPVTWNFGYQDDKYISAGVDLDKMWVPDDTKDSVEDAPYFNKGRRIPAHNTYGNRISQDDLLDTFKTVMKTGSDEDVDILVGQLIELKKDYLADINDKDLDLTETKKYYSKYKQIAKSYLNSKINQKFTKAVNEFVNSIKDSVEDSYYSEKDKQNKEFVKSSLEEMRRYVRNWNYLSSQDKRNIGCSLSELQKRIKELESVQDSVKDRKELISKAWEEEDFKDPSAKDYWDREWKVGLNLQKTNPNKFRQWVRESYNDLKNDLKEGYIKKEVLEELMDILVNDSVKDSKIYYVIETNNKYVGWDDKLYGSWSEFVQCFNKPEQADKYAKALDLNNYKIKKYDYDNKKVLDEDSVEDAHEYKPKGNEYLYLFPSTDMDNKDIQKAKSYGLEYVGINKYQGEKNLVLRGSKSNLRRYANEYLGGYELHPDFLYREKDFAGDIEDSCKDTKVFAGERGFNPKSKGYLNKIKQDLESNGFMNATIEWLSDSIIEISDIRKEYNDIYKLLKSKGYDIEEGSYPREIWLYAPDSVKDSVKDSVNTKHIKLINVVNKLKNYKDSKVKDVKWEQVVRSKYYTGVYPSIFGKAGEIETSEEARLHYGKACGLYKFDNGKTALVVGETKSTLKNCWLDNPQGSYVELGNAQKIQDDNKKHVVYFYD